MTGRVPVAKLVLRDKEHLVAIVSHASALTLHTLFLLMRWLRRIP